MAAQVIFNKVSRNPGTYSLTSTAVPSGITLISLSFDRTSWNNGTGLLQMTLEASFDGGTTWKPWGGFTSKGGTVLNPDGTTATISVFNIDIPQPQNANRKLRGTLTISGQALTTSGSVTLS